MANKSISINKIRQVLRCYASDNGTKSISSMLNMSRNKIKKYLHIYQKSGFSIEEILLMDDSSLHILFQENEKRMEEPSERYKELQSLLPDYTKRLKKKVVTRHQLFLEYPSSHPDGYAEKTYNGLRQIKECFPKTIPHKALYIKAYICSCYAFLFIFDFPNSVSKHILQYHSFFLSLFRRTSGLSG